MTKDAGTIEKYLLSAFFLLAGRHYRGFELMGHPLFELILRLRNNPQGHVSVLQPAELSALSAEFSRTVGLDPMRGHA